MADDARAMATLTSYARNGDVNLAYQVHGDGPLDLLFVNAFVSHVEYLWEDPGFARFLTRLTRFARLIIWDRRGTGLSDDAPLAVEHEIHDIDAVLDAAGSERAAVLAYNTGGPLAALYAARRTERVSALVLYGCLLGTVRDEDLPWIESADTRERRVGAITERWGEGTNIGVLAPTAADDPQLRAWLARLERMAASPGQMRRLMEAAGRIDVRPALASICSPTLVLHRSDEVLVDIRHSQELARRIPGAQLVELGGVDSLPSAGDTDGLLDEIEEFLTGGRRGGEHERALRTVLFTDIVGSTARAAQIGDKRWRDLLAVHGNEVRRTLRRYEGEVVQRIGDGFLVAFDGAPSRAVRCAAALHDVVGGHDIDVRIGVHTGECEILGGDLGGLAVHIAARVGALAGPGETLVSGTTYGTIVGCELDFDYRGEHRLKGVPGRWPIFALNR